MSAASGRVLRLGFSGVITLVVTMPLWSAGAAEGDQATYPPTKVAMAVAQGTGSPKSTSTSVARLGTRALAHRLFVVAFAGRRAHHVRDSAAAYNEKHFGVRTPAEIIHSYRPGGVIYFAQNIASVDQVRALSARLQQAAAREGYQLLVMTDQEGGTVRRLPGRVARNQPSAESYDGRVRPARRDAEEVGTAMRRMGVRVNLAPVADVNTVGDDGVIQSRSFGSTPQVVSPMVVGQVHGYHRGGVATTLKHWPGHGSTRVDSHTRLPTIDLSVRKWKRVHLPPFRDGVDAGADLVMVGHLAFPRLDPSGRPASLSPVLNHSWLRGRLGFEGVVITDALTMGALKGFGDAGDIAVQAFRSGADLLLMSGAPRAAARRIVTAVKTAKLERSDLAASVGRVLALQERLGLG